jgi:hypothetical protein
VYKTGYRWKDAEEESNPVRNVTESRGWWKSGTSRTEVKITSESRAEKERSCVGLAGFSAVTGNS